MVHERHVHTGGPARWLANVMYKPLYQRGIVAYGKHLWGEGLDVSKECNISR